MEELFTVKKEEVEDLCFAENGLMEVNDSGSLGNVLIKTEDAEASNSQSTASNRNPMDSITDKHTRLSSSSNRMLVPILPASNVSNTIGGTQGSGGNLASSMIIPSNISTSVVSSLNPSVVSNLNSNINAGVVTNINSAGVSNMNAGVVPNISPSVVSPNMNSVVSNINSVGMSNMNTGVVANINPSVVSHSMMSPNMNPSVVSNMNSSGMANVNAGVVPNISPGMVSNMNSSGVSSMNSSGIVPGVKPLLTNSVCPCNNNKKFDEPTQSPTQQLSTEQMSLQRSDRLPISRDPMQVPLNQLSLPRDPPQAAKESSKGQPEQAPVPYVPRVKRAKVIENVQMDGDIADSLYRQSLALNRLILAMGERNNRLETFVTSGTSHQEKFVKVFEQIYKEQEEIRNLVQEQDKLVQGHVQQQHQQMVLLLETMKQNQEQQHREMQNLQKQMLGIQEQLIMWEQDWMERQKQQAEQLEMLQSIENLKKE